MARRRRTYKMSAQGVAAALVATGAAQVGELRAGLRHESPRVTLWMEGQHEHPVRVCVPHYVGKLRAFGRVLAAGPVIADELGTPLAQLAIAWVLHQPGVTAAIAGSRNGGHMEENAGAAALDLSGVLNEIEQLISLGPGFQSTEGSWTL